MNNSMIRSEIQYTDKKGNKRTIYKIANPLPFRVTFWDTKVNFPMDRAYKTMDEALESMESLRYMENIDHIELMIVREIWSWKKE